MAILESTNERMNHLKWRRHWKRECQQNLGTTEGKLDQAVQVPRGAQSPEEQEGHLQQLYASSR